MRAGLLLSIPALIHQTDKIHRETDITRTWIDVNPGYKYRLYDDKEAYDFVRDHFSQDIFQTYIEFPKPVLRADFFRYLVLYEYGGVYADTDTKCLKPVDDWTDGRNDADIRLIVGVEFDRHRNWGVHIGDYGGIFSIIQWVMAASPRHPIIKNVIDKIVASAKRRSYQPYGLLESESNIDYVLEWTGPRVWTHAIVEYIGQFGIIWQDLEDLVHGIQVGDVYVLPITGFSPGLGYSRPIDDPEAKVQHLFQGSWHHSH